MNRYSQLIMKSGLLHMSIALMVIISGLAMGVHKPEEEKNGEESLTIEITKISGDDEVFTHTYAEWEITIIVTNIGDIDYHGAIMTSTLPAEIECIAYKFTHGALEITQHGKGKSGAKYLSWTIDVIGADENVTLSLLLCSSRNPAGHQEFTSPGEYMIIKEAF